MAQRLLYLAIAIFFFLLAVVGMILPLVPATPFLLITSYFLVRSFPALNERLLAVPYIGTILYDWEVRKGIKTSVKWQAIGTVLAGYIISMIFFPIPWLIAKVVLAILVTIGVLYVIRLPAPREDIPTQAEAKAAEESE